MLCGTCDMRRRYSRRGRHDATSTFGAWEERYSPQRYPTAKRLGEPTVLPPAPALAGIELMASQTSHGPALALGSHSLTDEVTFKEAVHLQSKHAAETSADSSASALGEEDATANFVVTQVSEHEHEAAPATGAGADGRRLGGFLFNFTVEPDCASILPYGERSFPPELSAGRLRNFRANDFPVHYTPCQPITLDGVQITRDRPFTIAELIMQESMERSLLECLTPDDSSPCASVLVLTGGVPPQAISPLGGFLTARNLDGGNCTVVCPELLECVHAAIDAGNLTSSARSQCLSTPNGQTCAARTKASFTPLPGNVGYTRSGFKGICLNYDCLACVVELFELYFTCAVRCQVDSSNSECIDCSYTYDNSHAQLLLLRTRLWESYLLGALGEYALNDILLANFTSCAHSGKTCLSMDAYRAHALGIGDSPSYYNTGEGSSSTYSYAYDQ